MGALWLTVLVVLVAAAGLGIGYAVGTRRAAARQPAAPVPESAFNEVPARLGALVTRTGAELAQIAVRTGVELGNRAIRDSLGALSTWAQQERPDLRQVTGADGTVTLMFTDIQGSTALNQRLGDERWLDVLAAHDRLLRRCVGKSGGQVIKTQGDSFMVAFADPERALTCAVAIQRALLTLDAGDDVALEVRIGLHTGEAIARGRDLFGISVATAARVAGEARGGQILVTDDVASRLHGSHELGRRRKVALKGIRGAQQVRSVVWDG